MIDAYVFSRLPPPPIGVSRDLRVLWALEELGLPYRTVGLDFEHDLKTPEHRARSPFAQLPVIDDDGFVLSESGAIELYLAEKAGQIGAADPRRRDEVSRWCFAALTTIEPPLVLLLSIHFGGEDAVSAAFRASTLAWANRMLGDLETRLARQAYLVDDGFSVADILLTTVLREIVDPALLAAYPHVAAYRRRCEDRPAWQRTLDAYEDRLGVERGTARRS